MQRWIIFKQRQESCKHKNKGNKKMPTFPDSCERCTFFFLQPDHLQGYQLPIYSGGNKRKVNPWEYVPVTALIFLQFIFYAFLHWKCQWLNHATTTLISVRLGIFYHHYKYSHFKYSHFKYSHSPRPRFNRSFLWFPLMFLPEWN